MQTDEKSDCRGGRRLNMFVNAVLCTSSGSAAVRIRNISATGAMINGKIPADKDERVRLSRGSVAVNGRLVWKRDDKAGMEFFSTLTPDAWLPTEHAGQQYVDKIVENIRTRGGSKDLEAESLGKGPRMLRTFSGVCASVQQVAEALADDPYVLDRHSASIQLLLLAIHDINELRSDSGSQAQPVV